jgi:hypothetical protein
VVHQNREIEKNHQILRVTAGPEIRHFIIRSLIRRGETIVASARIGWRRASSTAAGFIAIDRKTEKPAPDLPALLIF